MDLTSSITLSRRTTSKVASKVISATMNVGAGATSKVAKTINAAKLTAAGTEKLTPSVLLNRLRNPAPLKPSEHVTEIVELLNMADHTSQTDCDVEIGKPIFQPFPPAVTIHDYQPFEPVAVRITFRNNDRFARRLRVLAPESSNFTVSGPTTAKGLPISDGRAAPGTEVTFTVTFTPGEITDYSCRLVCATEREKFIVPLKADGKKAMLNMPDAVSFPSLPVRSSSTKVFVVRNVGSKGAEFSLQCPPGFSASPSKGFVDVEQTVPVTLTFKPLESRPYETDLTVNYSDGSHSHTCFIELGGAGHDVEVHMDTNALALGSTYVSLEGKAKVTVTNRSDLPLEFSWKAFPGLLEEDDARALRLAQLEEQYYADRAMLEASVARAGAGGAPDSPTSANQHNAGGGAGAMSLSHQAELVALERRYKGQRAEVEAQPLDFLSTVFDIQPSSGTIWSKNSLEFTVLFRPNDAREFTESAFLEITGRSERLPLTMSGIGIGPRLAWAYDIVDCGDVSVTSVHRYELLLTNRGEIGAEWAFSPPTTTFGSKFLFDPPNGSIRVGETVPISVYFTSDTLGSFSEIFELVTLGCTAILRVHFKGVVVPPSMSLSTDKLDFGLVAYDFPQTKTFTLTNTSDVPLSFNLRVPQDLGLQAAAQAAQLSLSLGSSGFGFTSTARPVRKREFTIQPATGSLQPKESVEVAVEFTSNTVQSYDGYALSVSLDNVADDLQLIPITAGCMVPNVELKDETIEYGKCFLRFPATRMVTLVNTDPVAGRYEILPQDEQTVVVAAFSSEQGYGVLPPNSETTVPVQLVCYRGGPFVLPMLIRVFGVDSEPLKVELQGEAVGPSIICNPSSIAWGMIPCLKPNAQTITVHNDSTIPAPVRFGLKGGARSRFLTNAQDGVLEPGQKLPVSVTALLDDVAPFADELQIHVTEGGVVSVPLAAKGTGCTVSNTLNWDGTYDFGAVFTNSHQGGQVAFTLENKGKKTQNIVFVNTAFEARKAEAKREEKKRQAALSGGSIADSKAGGSKRPSGTDANAVAAAAGASSGDEKENVKGGSIVSSSKGGKVPGLTTSGATVIPGPPIFMVEPAQVMLRPGQACDFILKGYCEKPGRVAELIEWQYKGENDRGFGVVGKLNVTADMIDPLLAFDPPTSISFLHEHHPSMDQPDPYTGQLPNLLQSKPLTLINTSTLPLDFTLRCAAPFSLDGYEFSMAPGERQTINVTFDPTYKEDKMSQFIEGKITAVYRDHPRKDSFKVIGDIRFPNIHIEKLAVDFGCVLNDTVASQVVMVTNNSMLPLEASWVFEEPAATVPGSDNDTGGSKGTGSSAGLKSPGGGSSSARTGGGVAETLALPSSAHNLAPIPVNQAFDIRPIRLQLAPGESAPVEFVFYGHPGRKLAATAVCELAGGPEYSVSLKGEASQASFKVDVSKLSFGSIPFDATETRDFIISNTGRVEYTFDVKRLPLPLPGMDPQTGEYREGADPDGDLDPELRQTLQAFRQQRMVVTPSTGTIPPGSRVKVQVHIRPGVPETFSETLRLSVGLFEPVTISVDGEGVFAGVAAMLPKDNQHNCYNDFEAHVQRLVQEHHQQQQRLMLQAAAGSAQQAATIRARQASTDHETFVDAGNAFVSEQPSISGGSIAMMDSLPGLDASASLADVGNVAGSQSPHEKSAVNAPPNPFAHRFIPPALPLGLQGEGQALRRLLRNFILKTLPPLPPNPNPKKKPGKAASIITATAEVSAAGDGEESTAPDGSSSPPAGASKPPAKGGKGAGGGGNDSASVLSGGTGYTGGTSGFGTSVGGGRVHPVENLVWESVLLDMGNIVLGSAKKKTLTLFNLGKLPATISVEKPQLYNTGFNVEPLKITNLPEGSCVELEVSFDPRTIKHAPGKPAGPGGTRDPLGRIGGEMLLKVGKGPAVVVNLTLNVTLPDVRLTPDLLDFSNVFVGQEKDMAVQLHNFTPVTITWTVPPPLPSARSADREAIRCWPDAGQLAPGERCAITVTFTPSEKRAYSCPLPIKVNLNPASRNIMIRGAGESPELSFNIEDDPAAEGRKRAPLAPAPDPHTVECGPQLPGAVPGASRVVTVTNKGSTALELISVDFDPQLRAEAKALAFYPLPKPTAFLQQQQQQALGATGALSEMPSTTGTLPAMPPEESAAAKGLHRLPLREPGQLLGEDIFNKAKTKEEEIVSMAVKIYQEHEEKKRAEEAAAAAADPFGTAGSNETGVAATPSAGGSASPLATTDATATSANDAASRAGSARPTTAGSAAKGRPGTVLGSTVGSPQDFAGEALKAAANTPRMQRRALNVLLMGPPLTGVSTQAQALAQALAAATGSHGGALPPVVTLDSAIQWARSGAGGKALADAIRQFVKADTYVNAADAAAVAEAETAGQLAPKKDTDAAGAKGGKADPKAAAKGGKADPKAAAAEAEAAAAAAAALAASQPPPPGPYPRVPVKLVVDALRARARAADAGKAIIIDGADRCSYLASTVEAVLACQQAFGSHKDGKLFVFDLTHGFDAAADTDSSPAAALSMAKAQSISTGSSYSDPAALATAAATGVDLSVSENAAFADAIAASTDPNAPPPSPSLKQRYLRLLRQYKDRLAFLNARIVALLEAAEKEKELLLTAQSDASAATEASAATKASSAKPGGKDAPPAAASSDASSLPPVKADPVELDRLKAERKTVAVNLTRVKKLLGAATGGASPAATARPGSGGLAGAAPDAAGSYEEAQKPMEGDPSIEAVFTLHPLLTAIISAALPVPMPAMPTKPAGPSPAELEAAARAASASAKPADPKAKGGKADPKAAAAEAEAAAKAAAEAAALAAAMDRWQWSPLLVPAAAVKKLAADAGATAAPAPADDESLPADQQEKAAAEQPQQPSGADKPLLTVQEAVSVLTAAGVSAQSLPADCLFEVTNACASPAATSVTPLLVQALPPNGLPEDATPFNMDLFLPDPETFTLAKRPLLPSALNAIMQGDYEAAAHLLVGLVAQELQAIQQRKDEKERERREKEAAAAAANGNASPPASPSRPGSGTPAAKNAPRPTSAAKAGGAAAAAAPASDAATGPSASSPADAAFAIDVNDVNALAGLLRTKLQYLLDLASNAIAASLLPSMANLNSSNGSGGRPASTANGKESAVSKNLSSTGKWLFGTRAVDPVVGKHFRIMTLDHLAKEKEALEAQEGIKKQQEEAEAKAAAETAAAAAAAADPKAKGKPDPKAAAKGGKGAAPDPAAEAAAAAEKAKEEAEAAARAKLLALVPSGKNFDPDAAALANDSNGGRVRWSLQPGQSVQFIVRYASAEVGLHEGHLSFAVTGMNKTFRIPVRGVCAVPTINTDPRNVFMARAKSVVGGPGGIVHKKFVVSKSTFEFGPLPAGRSPADRVALAQLQALLNAVNAARKGSRPPTSGTTGPNGAATPGRTKKPSLNATAPLSPSGVNGSGSSGSGAPGSPGGFLAGTANVGDLSFARDPASYHQANLRAAAIGMHCDKWRITNNGLFPANVDFALANKHGDTVVPWVRRIGPLPLLEGAEAGGADAGAAADAAARPASGKAAAAAAKGGKAEPKAAAAAPPAAAAPEEPAGPPESIFIVDPPMLRDLAPGETAEVTVWAFPKKSAPDADYKWKERHGLEGPPGPNGLKKSASGSVNASGAATPATAAGVPVGKPTSAGPVGRGPEANAAPPGTAGTAVTGINPFEGAASGTGAGSGVAGMHYSNILQIRIADNEKGTIEIPVSCIGSTGALELHGPWENLSAEAQAAAEKEKEEAAAKAAAEAAAAADPKAKGKPDPKAAAKGGKPDPKAAAAEAEAAAKAAAEAASKEKEPDYIVDFQRQLIGQTSERSFTITNTSLMAVAWRIDLGSLAQQGAFVDVKPLPHGYSLATAAQVDGYGPNGTTMNLSSRPGSKASGPVVVPGSSAASAATGIDADASGAAPGSPASASGASSAGSAASIAAQVPSFRITPLEGMLNPGQTATISAAFGSDLELIKRQIIAVEYCEAETGGFAAAAAEAKAAMDAAKDADAKAKAETDARPPSAPAKADPKAASSAKGGKPDPKAAAAPVPAAAPATTEEKAEEPPAGPLKVRKVPVLLKGEVYRVVGGMRFEDQPSAAGSTAAAGATGDATGRPPSAAKADPKAAAAAAAKGGKPDPKAAAGAPAAEVPSTEGAAPPAPPPPLPSLGAFDYGLLRVGESATRTIPLSNHGKYPLRYTVSLTPAARTASALGGFPPLPGSHHVPGTPAPASGDELLTVGPAAEGVLQPKEETNVAITFKAKREIRLHQAKLLTVTLSDASTGAVTDIVPVAISVTTTFSKFVFLPSRGLNFGAVRYGEEKERKAELKNTGPFAFEWRVVPANSKLDAACTEITTAKADPTSGATLLTAGAPASATPAPAADPKAKGGKPDPKAAAAAAAAPAAGSGGYAAAKELASKGGAGDITELGRFLMEPLQGTLQPGQSVTLQAVYFACGNGPHKSQARLHISGYNHVADAQLSNLLYDLNGESVVPGIACGETTGADKSGGMGHEGSGWSDIFEEHPLVDTSDQLGTGPYVSNPAAAAAATANIVSTAAAAAAASAPASSRPGTSSGGRGGSVAPAPPVAFTRSRCGFAVAEKTFSFGYVVPTCHPDGVTERVRLHNPGKVPATVNISVKDDPSVASGAAPVFSLPNVTGPITIAPHESTYVDIRFNPSSVRSYTGSFLAEVEGGIIESTKRLAFGLKGEGALPIVAVIEPGASAREAASTAAAPAAGAPAAPAGSGASMDAGSLLMEFGKVSTGSKRSKTIALHNPGIFPAVVEVEMTASKTFRFENAPSVLNATGFPSAAFSPSRSRPGTASVGSSSLGDTLGSSLADVGGGGSSMGSAGMGDLTVSGGRSTSLTLLPGQRWTLNVCFAPLADAILGPVDLPGQLGIDETGAVHYGSDVKITVVSNPYALERIKMTAQAQLADVLFEGLKPYSSVKPAAAGGAGGATRPSTAAAPAAAAGRPGTGAKGAPAAAAPAAAGAAAGASKDGQGLAEVLRFPDVATTGAAASAVSLAPAAEAAPAADAAATSKPGSAAGTRPGTGASVRSFAAQQQQQAAVDAHKSSLRSSKATFMLTNNSDRPIRFVWPNDKSYKPVVGPAAAANGATPAGSTAPSGAATPAIAATPAGASGSAAGSSLTPDMIAAAQAGDSTAIAAVQASFFSFSPSCGHIPPGGRVPITATFTPDPSLLAPKAGSGAAAAPAAPISVDCLPVKLQYCKVTYSQQVAAATSEQRRRIAMGLPATEASAEDAAAAAAAADAAAKGGKGGKPDPKAAKPDPKAAAAAAKGGKPDPKAAAGGKGGAAPAGDAGKPALRKRPKRLRMANVPSSSSSSSSSNELIIGGPGASSSSAAPVEPAVEWTSEHKSVMFVPFGSPAAEQALNNGTGVVVQNGRQVKITQVIEEPDYAVVEDNLSLPLGAEDEEEGAAPDAAAAAAAPASDAGGSADGAGGIKAVPVTAEAEQYRTTPLSVVAVADAVRYELKGLAPASSSSSSASSSGAAAAEPGVEIDNDTFLATRALTMKPTMMFETRAASFTVANPSLTALKFEWFVSPNGPNGGGGAAAAAAQAQQGGASAAGGGSPRSNNLVVGVNTYALPFSIEPSVGEIKAGETATFTAKFNPLDADDYDCSATMIVANLAQGTPPLSLTLSGRSQRPLCHIDIPATDYLRNRPHSELPGPKGETGPLEAATRCLEIPSLGLNTRNLKRFYAVNPTNGPYEFAWELVGPPGTTAGGAGAPATMFKCLTPKGMIMPGRRCEMSFEFTPVATKTAESFWRLTLGGGIQSHLFLVAGTVAEPKVSLDRSSVQFRQLLVGTPATETIRIVNEEAQPFAFEFTGLQLAMEANGLDKNSFRVLPSQGVVPPHSALPVEISLVPAHEGIINMNLTVSIQRKAFPLSLNVKGEGYALHEVLSLQDAPTGGSSRPVSTFGAEGHQVSFGGPGGGASVDLSPHGLNYLDFGPVSVQEKSTRKITISNNGSFPFDFNWALVPATSATMSATGGGGAAGVKGLARGGAKGGKRSVSPPQRRISNATSANALTAAQSYLSITPESGRVIPRGGQVTVEVEFKPQSEVALGAMNLLCVIGGGAKRYVLATSGRGVKAALELSSYEIDFGDCLLPPKPAMAALPVTFMLRALNREHDRDLSLQLLTTKPKHPGLDIGFDAGVLRPGQVLDIPITFAPRTAGPLGEELQFEVNGAHIVTVAVRGDGVPLVLDAVPAGGVGGGGATGLASTAVSRAGTTAAGSAASEAAAAVDGPDVSFGAIRPGQRSGRGLRITNRSRRAVMVELLEEQDAKDLIAAKEKAQAEGELSALGSTTGSLPPPSRAATQAPPFTAGSSSPAAGGRGGRGGAGAGGSGATGLAALNVAIGPRRFLARPRETVTVDLGFSPSARVLPFKVPIFARVSAAGGSQHPHDAASPAGGFSDPFALCTLSGACLGLEVALETDTLSFGTVCEGAKVTRPLALFNTGDLPVQFKWDVAALTAGTGTAMGARRSRGMGGGGGGGDDDNHGAGQFTVAPLSGTVPPHADTTFTVTFAPRKAGSDIRLESVPLYIDGLKQPLFFTALGDCVAKPAPTGPALNFNCRVRETAQQTIQLPKNETDKPWLLTPVLSNEYWAILPQGTNTIEVAPRTQASVTVVYKPMTMTLPPAPGSAPAAAADAADPKAKGGKPDPKAAAKGAPAPAPAAAAPAPAPAADAKPPSAAAGTSPLLALPGAADPSLQVALPEHKGTLFVALPDGTGVTYSLVGTATEPASAGSLQLTTPAKKTLPFSLTVPNPLRPPQKYRCEWDPSLVPVHATLKGPKGIEVPGRGSRECKFTFSSLLEGKVGPVPIHFTSELTGERYSFDVSFETQPAGAAGSYSLSAVVRQQASQIVLVENPLHATRAQITWQPPIIDHPSVRAVQLLDATGLPEGRWRIDYRPLVPSAAPGDASRPTSAAATAVAPADPKAKGGKADPKAAAAPATPQQPLDASKARVILRSEQLGDYIYDLALQAIPAAQEATMRFTASLGAKTTQTFRWKHFPIASSGPAAAAPANYKVTLSHPDLFSVPAPTVPVTVPTPSPGTEGQLWDGVEASVEVTFEGTSIGTVGGATGENNITMTLTNEAAGPAAALVVPLQGTCTAPRPAGPFVIPSVAIAPNGIPIDFRNVFGEDKEFTVSTDNPGLFAVTPVGVVKLTKKAGAAFTVKYQPSAPPAGGADAAAAPDVHGKMVVSCPSLPDLPPWVFYLKGTSNPATAAAAGVGAGSGAAAPAAGGKKK